MKNRIAIPNSLAAIAAACCLALAWAGHDHDPSADTLVAAASEPERMVESDETDFRQPTDSRGHVRLPDLTFFLLPGNRAR